MPAAAQGMQIVNAGYQPVGVCRTPEKCPCKYYSALFSDDSGLRGSGDYKTEARAEEAVRRAVRSHMWQHGSVACNTGELGTRITRPQDTTSRGTITSSLIAFYKRFKEAKGIADHIRSAGKSGHVSEGYFNMLEFASTNAMQVRRHLNDWPVIRLANLMATANGQLSQAESGLQKYAVSPAASVPRRPTPAFSATSLPAARTTPQTFATPQPKATCAPDVFANIRKLEAQYRELSNDPGTDRSFLQQLLSALNQLETDCGLPLAR
jgi:hypothetical protein